MLANLAQLWRPAGQSALSCNQSTQIVGSLKLTSQTFVSSRVAFRTLPRPEFAALQSATLPFFFSIEAAVPVILALTWSKHGQASSPLELLTPGNRSKTLAPLATVTVAGLVNLFFLRPLILKVMGERKNQGMYLSSYFGLWLTWTELRDGKKYYDPAPHSKEMQALNKRFVKIHSASSLVGLLSIFASVYYGFTLGKRLS